MDKPDPPAEPDAAALARCWQLDPAITFLNHGSFGACPTSVLQLQRELRDQMEAEPVRFFTRELPPLLDASRAALAALLVADPLDLVFISNATAAVNCVLRSLRLEPGDELLVTDHAYRACRNVFDYLNDRHGIGVQVAAIAFPCAGDEQVVEAVMAKITPRTRLAMLDHVTSATGLLLPIERLVAELQSRGIDVLVDGAHAPGMVPLDLNRLGAAYYTGNLHKWLCAPKGAAFLHVRRDRQAGIVPGVISHGFSVARPGRSRFHDLFDWPGTVDPTPWLCVNAAISFVDQLLPTHLPGLMRRNRQLALHGRDIVCQAAGVKPPCPAEMIGSIAAIELPLDPVPGGDIDVTTSPTPQHAMQTRLMDRHKIEVPVYHYPAPPRRILRISAQAYNDIADYERLAQAVKALLAEEQAKIAAAR